MRDILHGSTDQSIIVRIVDSTDGTPETGVTVSTGGLAFWYRREGGAKVAIGSLSNLGAVDAAHADGGLIHISDGYYRVDSPDAAFASGVKGVAFGGSATGMVVIGSYYPLVAYDNQSAANLGLSDLSTLVARLSATRAGYLDNLAAGAVALNADMSTVLSRISAARAGYLDNLNVGGLVGSAADLATLLARISASRAGYLDNLNIGGPVASSAEATAIQNNTRVVRVVPQVIERPDSGSTAYRIELLLYDEVGNMEAPDAAPTLNVVDESGNSRDGNLDSTTMALVSTGRYRAVYTVGTAHDLEQLIFAFSVVEGGATRLYANAALVVDTSAVDFTSADRAKLDTLHDTRLTAGRAALLDNLDAPVSGRATPAQVLAQIEAWANTALPGSPAADSPNERLKAIDDKLPAGTIGDATAANQTTILNRLGAWTGSGVNTVLGAFKALLSKTASTPSDIGGTFAAADDSTEAIRDRGDAAWGGGGGGGGDATLANQTTILANQATLLAATDTVEAGIATLISATDTVEAGIATVQSNQTTILGRLGAWAGSGANTILGALKALASKDAPTPSDIGGTYAPAAHSLEAIRARGDAAWGGGGGGSAAVLLTCVPSYNSGTLTLVLWIEEGGVLMNASALTLTLRDANGGIVLADGVFTKSAISGAGGKWKAVCTEADALDVANQNYWVDATLTVASVPYARLKGLYT